MIKIAITLTIIHLVYYAYFQIISDIMRIGMVHNTPNKVINALRTDFKVNIRTFQKNSNHYGFAMFRTIYINEKLFPKERAVRWTFHHEFYHLKHHHKAWTLIIRFFFALVPLLLIWHWIPFAIAYVISAKAMEIIKNRFETKADAHANKIMKVNETITI
jgi:hypothetical protein